MLDEALSAGRRTKAILLAGIAVAIGVFLFIAYKFQIPTYPHFGGSLLIDMTVRPVSFSRPVVRDFDIGSAAAINTSEIGGKLDQ